MADHGHAKLSPSQAKRWINCAGSVALAAKAPRQAASEYAAEGTVAHTLAELYVTGKIDFLELSARIGKTVKQEGFEIEVGEDMVDGAVEYHDEIAADRRAMEMTPKPMKVLGEAERKVCASSVDPDLWGTADYLLYRKGDTLFVHDYKFGAGVIVDPEENEQAMIYAIAAMDELGWAFDKVVIKIVQPRGQHIDGTVREWSPSIARLKEFREELRAAVKRTREPNAPVVAGEWCQWCPAKPYCPAIHAAAQASAAMDFEVVAPMTPAKAAEKLQEVRLLPVAKLATMLAWKDTVKALFSAVEDVVREKLSAGEDVPGWKLVEGRPGNRKWAGEAAVVAQYAPVLGVEKLYERKLLSPAKLEKALGGKAKVPEELTTRSEGSKAIARDTDPRPQARPAAAMDFEVVKPEVTHVGEPGDLMDELMGAGSAAPKREPMWPQ